MESGKCVPSQVKSMIKVTDAWRWGVCAGNTNKSARLAIKRRQGGLSCRWLERQVGARMWKTWHARIRCYQDCSCGGVHGARASNATFKKGFQNLAVKRKISKFEIKMNQYHWLFPFASESNKAQNDSYWSCLYNIDVYWSLQQMLSKQLYIHMQKNEVGPTRHIIYKNWLKAPDSPKCKG